MLASLSALAGCGSDDGGGGGGNNNPAVGPEITFFGVTRADDTLLQESDTTNNGTPIYVRSSGGTGTASGFVLVIEGTPGSNSLAVGTSSYDPTLGSFPNLIVQASHDLGDGSPAVCDDPITMPGGVPGKSRSDLDLTADNIARINDFACRFVDGAGQPLARQVSTDSCVNFDGDFRFVDPQTTVQFCGFINVPIGFPPGDTRVVANLTDVEGNIGPSKSLIIRVVP
jgi:hypothetical protein